MVDAVAFAVDDGLLEAERIDQETDESPGIMGSKRGPHLRWRCLVGHDISLPPPLSGWIGKIGTPEPATWCVSCQPSRGSPGPGEPGRSNRNWRQGPPGPARGRTRRGAAAVAWPGESGRPAPPPWASG